MRKVIMICDRCGKEIETLMYGLNVNTVEPGTGDFANERPDISSQLEELDFCQGCIEKIVRYAKGGMKINQEFEAAVQGMTDKESKNEKLANTEITGAPENSGLAKTEKKEKFEVKKTPSIFEAAVESIDEDIPDEAREEMAEIDKLMNDLALPEKKAPEKTSGKKTSGKYKPARQVGPTVRQKVWELHKKGMSAKDIASELMIAYGTVSQYIYLSKKEEKENDEK